MPDASSDAGYALMALGLCGLLATHVLIFSNPWRRLPSTRTDDSKPGEVQIVLGGDTLAVHLALANIFSALLLAAGNIAVYRIVLAEHLLGVVLTWGHGPVAVTTTLLIVLALCYLGAANLVWLGSRAPLSRPRAFAARGLGAMAIIVLILAGKLAMGIVYYDDPFVCAGENRSDDR